MKLNKENNTFLKHTRLGAIEKEQEQFDMADKNETLELKNRMKVLMNKFNVVKKDKENLQRENQNLQQEILQMQTHLRSMITGFSNTGNTFPMLNELSNNIAEFYKCEVFDIFFDVLTQELNIKGLIFFFQQTLIKIQKCIEDYFGPSYQLIKKTGCLDTIDGPIMNVLRKSFQTKHLEIQQKCFKMLPSIEKDLIKTLKFEENEIFTKYLGNVNEILQIKKERLAELMLNCYICDPPLQFEIITVGEKILFNQTKHDPIDGFIKNKEECIILLPQVFKGQEQLTKALVISSQYQLENL